MKISVIIPSYNEALIIKNTVDEVIDILKKLNVEDYEIIIIDDHSSDGTFALIKSLNNPKVVCYRLSRNSGSHIALRAGLFYSTGDAVLCMSADGQDDPNCLEAMLKKWKEGKKIAWALRQNRDNESLMIKYTAKVFYRMLLWLIDSNNMDIDISRADFYLLDRQVVNAINACKERNSSLFGLMIYLGFSQDFVLYERRQRVFGMSRWTFKSRMRLAKDWIVAFSGVPLKLASYFGIMFALAGFIYSVYVVLNAIFGHPGPGWSSIIITILVMGGIQMSMIGILGEYLLRNLDEARNRPLYFVESATVEDKKL